MSAVGVESMRGLDRVLAGIVLAGAVGGVAVFARHSGTSSPAHAVALAAPPLQHIGAPGTVLFAQTPARRRVAAVVRGQIQVEPSAGRTLRLQATPPQPLQPRTPLPKPDPAPAPIPPPVAPAPVEPVQAPQHPRVLAAAKVAPAQPAGKGKGHGRGKGHAKHGHDAQPAGEASGAPVAAPGPEPAPPATGAAQATPVNPSQTSSDDGAANGDTTGAAHGHGHAWGHTKDGAASDGD
jgi:hypothetical protein